MNPKCGNCRCASPYLYKGDSIWCLSESSKNFGKTLKQSNIACGQYAAKEEKPKEPIIITTYAICNECVDEEGLAYEICSKCGRCGRVFNERGVLVNSGGTTDLVWED